MKPMDNKDAKLFNDVYMEIGNTIGIETAVEIFNMYKGQQITFPVHLFNIKRIQLQITDEYDGKNLKELAKKYGYSEKTLRRILKETKNQ